ncbi:hotdog domain-containing protein [Roseovarius atlanticus]|uniref:hotdog domain-containing protein n=1 Tax=Roseovarius atlanticus TaxID=1641875 RepID=UPI001C963DD3|nr:hypothetical protein [Roseovarius atlanticus]MBY6123697.1 hypothetical protein [Roseovarius atlanticus]MBY6148192.1 hypothetical protein [Roseovarius atlanticus]
MGLSAPTVIPLSVSFLRSVMVGDEVSIFTGIERVGRTSLTIRAEAWRRDDSEGLPTVGELLAEASDGEEGGWLTRFGTSVSCRYFSSIASVEMSPGGTG